MGISGLTEAGYRITGYRITGCETTSAERAGRSDQDGRVKSDVLIYSDTVAGGLTTTRSFGIESDDESLNSRTIASGVNLR
jgi:hypothetical protein